MTTPETGNSPSHRWCCKCWQFYPLGIDCIHTEYRDTTPTHISNFVLPTVTVSPFLPPPFNRSWFDNNLIENDNVKVV